MSESREIGDPCPSCGGDLKRRASMFYWRGTSYDGAVCAPCNSLWAIKGEEMPPLRPGNFGEVALKS